MALESYRLRDVVELYLTRCDVEGKRPNTVIAYRETLGQFLAAAEDLGLPDDVREITSEHIYKFLGWVKARDVSLETRHRRFREVRHMFVWLWRVGYIDTNPFEHMQNLSCRRK